MSISLDTRLEGCLTTDWEAPAKVTRDDRRNFSNHAERYERKHRIKADFGEAFLDWRTGRLESLHLE